MTTKGKATNKKKRGWDAAEKSVMAQGHSKESAGKILGAAAKKAKHPSAAQKRVLAAQKKGGTRNVKKRG